MGKGSEVPNGAEVLRERACGAEGVTLQCGSGLTASWSHCNVPLWLNQATLQCTYREASSARNAYSTTSSQLSIGFGGDIARASKLYRKRAFLSAFERACRAFAMCLRSL